MSTPKFDVGDKVRVTTNSGTYHGVIKESKESGGANLPPRVRYLVEIADPDAPWLESFDELDLEPLPDVKTRLGKLFNDHIYDGLCPDPVEDAGWAGRDPHCRACNILDEFERDPGFALWTLRQDTGVEILPDGAKAIIHDIRSLHSPIDNQGWGDEVEQLCCMCRDIDGMLMPWPCPTIEVLDV